MNKEKLELDEKEKKEFTLLDTYFKMPVRVYNDVERRRIQMDEEAKEESGVSYDPVDPSWIVGYRRIPYEMARNLQWVDGYSRSRSSEEVDEKGFDLTVVDTIEGDVYYCAWKREKFEKNFLAYLNLMEKYIKEQGELNKKEAEDGSKS